MIKVLYCSPEQFLAQTLPSMFFVDYKVTYMAHKIFVGKCRNNADNLPLKLAHKGPVRICEIQVSIIIDTRLPLLFGRKRGEVLKF